MKKENYDNINGLRVLSCFCLIAMHVKANADYSFYPPLSNFMVSWTHFVLLFLVISGFGMFCGYYEGFKNNEIDLNGFYTKRYMKILPFFLTLILIDVLMNRSISHFIEGITEATLVFGLLPNNQPDVIGVSWTLGVIFLYYMLFPFFVFLCWNKKRAWISFVISVLLSVFCSIYYFTERFVITDFTARHNFLYCAPFFLGGAMVYLYRNSIKDLVAKQKLLFILLCLGFTCVCFYLPNEGNNADIYILLRYLLLFVLWLMYAISVDSKLLNNRFTRYLGEISLEMYLAHMVTFRIVEKMNGLYILGHGIMSFIIAYTFVIILLLVFIRVWRLFMNFINIRLFGNKSL